MCHFVARETTLLLSVPLGVVTSTVPVNVWKYNIDRRFHRFLFLRSGGCDPWENRSRNSQCNRCRAQMSR
jgi:hypothetical protein